jgi:uncharacterized membrane protein YbaN (DUF454 family)
MLSDMLESSNEAEESTANRPAAAAAEASAAPRGRGWRWFLLLIGCAFLVLGGLGVFLPVLPTTPFVLVASACFVRSSPRLHRWLLQSRLFGPFLRDWQRYHGVRLHVKITAIVVLAAAVGASWYFGDLHWLLQVALVSLALVGLVVILRLRTIRVEEQEPPL